ncbi:sensor histidine kinase [Leeuwenhoekiella marinoflava]|uniref:sensor histidine kinase n=1 Tax=Leeuwenhoekiella marinoflava TaxID=988 RepID=UPI00300107A2
MIRLLPKLFCLLVFSLSFGQQTKNSKFNAYFQFLKELENQKAISQISGFKDTIYSVPLKTFANITYQGFTGDASEYQQLCRERESKNPFLNTIYLLNTGYFEFYFSQDRTAAYPYFYAALKSAAITKYKPLQRRVLRAILQYFHHEIARNNNNYQVFLDQYKDLIEDIHDQVYFQVYEVIFYSSVLEIKSVYHKKAAQLESLIPQLETNCKLLPKLYLEVALFYELSEKYDKSATFYQKVFNEGKNIPYYTDSRFSAMTKLAYLEHLKGKSNLAIEKLKEVACCYNPQDSLKNTFFVEYYLSKFYEAIQEDSLALAHYKAHVEAGHNINFRDNTLEISRLQVELETEKKANDLLLERQAKKRFLLITLGLLALLFILILIGYLVITNSKKRRKLAEQQNELEKERVKNLLKEQELASVDAMIAGQEKERTRIAGELHDDLGALMTNVRLHFESLKSSRAPDLFEKTDELLNEAYQKVRSIAHAKNSGVIANQGLLKAVKELAQKVSQLNGLEIEVVDHGMTNRLENTLEISIFRIIQELITNIIKHAQANSVTIHLINHGDTLNIMVEDDGVGFETRHVIKRSLGMGISNIDRRVEHLNGSLTLESEPGKGTTVIIDIPL